MISAAAARVLLLLPLVFYFQTPPAAQQQQPPPQQRPTTQEDEILRVNTELVQTDVTVVDKQGRFVPGLTREQFELSVDGKPMPISFFEELTAGGARETAILTASRAGAGATAPPAAAAPAAAERGRTTLFFLDDMHLEAGSMARVRETLLRFVDKMGPRDSAVIATASGQLGFLQQLTGDKEVLRAAVRRLSFRQQNFDDKMSEPPMNEYQAVAIERGDPDAVSYFVDATCEEFKRQGRPCGRASNAFSSPSAVLDEGYARPRGGGSGGNSNSSGGGGLGGNSGGDASSGPAARRGGGGGGRSEAEKFVRMRARTIARQAAHATRNMLGSLESLVRTAAAIPERKLVVFISDGFFLNYANSTNAYDLRRVADAALRSGTVIYTIDARGLTVGNIDARQRGGNDLQGRTVRMSLAEVTAAQDPLNSLAADTGGRAFFNSNDLDKGVVQAVAETSVYYLLAWRPDPPAEGKDRFRKIEVRVKDRPDLTVRVRSGFFAEDPAKAGDAAAASPPKTVEQQLADVIRAPYPRRSFPTALSAGHLFTPAGNMTVSAAVMVNPSALGGDAKTAEADLMLVLVNEKGDVVQSLMQHLNAAALSRAGRMVYTVQFPKLEPGLYQVRVASRDARTGRTGSASQWLEVPDASKNEFALSSIFLTEVPADAAAAQRAAVSPDGRFARASRMRIQSQIFNASRSAAGAPDLTFELQLSTGGRALVTTPPSPVAVQGVADLARVPLSAEFPLAGFAPGRYELKITITDRVARKSVTRQTEFTVD